MYISYALKVEWCLSGTRICAVSKLNHLESENSLRTDSGLLLDKKALHID